MKNIPFQDHSCTSRKNPCILPFSLPVKIISWILIAAMMNLYGCRNYFKVASVQPPGADKLSEFEIQHKTFIIHLFNQSWILEDPDVSGEALTGVAVRDTIKSKQVNPNRANRYLTRAKHDERYLLNEIHLYITELKHFPDSRVSIPLPAITKIEVYEKDQAATIASWTFGAVGITAATLSVILLIAILTKSSCPFIYTYDGDNFQFTGEIYSGSIHPPLERHDFMKLPCYKNDAKEYRLQITNEVKEIQHTNLMELWIFDHPLGTEIMVDKYGRAFMLQDPVSPSRAVDFTGEEITGLIGKKDTLFYTSKISDPSHSITDGIILDFPNPGNAVSAKLAIHAKNSFILDYMMGKFQNQYGDYYSKIVKRQRKAPAAQLVKWTVDQNIPLSLLVERNGTWQPVDYYNIAGPMAMKEDILEIPLDGTENDPLKVKLEFGSYFWEIDYVAVDYSAGKEILPQVIQPETAINQDGKEIRKTLQKDDRKYYVQPVPGDYAELKFRLPPPASGLRTLYLHTKGWYELIRDPHGEADLDYLRKFRQPGEFNRFVNKNIWDLVTEQKIPPMAE